MGTRPRQTLPGDQREHPRPRDGPGPHEARHRRHPPHPPHAEGGSGNVQAPQQEHVQRGAVEDFSGGGGDGLGGGRGGEKGGT